MGTEELTRANVFGGLLGSQQSQFGRVMEQQGKATLLQALGGLPLPPPTFPDVRFRRSEEPKIKTFYQNLKEEITNWLKITI